MLCEPARRRPHVAVPAFWSNQFGVNIKLVGVPSAADEVVVTQGSMASGRFVAAYGREGQVVAAVAFNQGRWLEYYQELIEQAAPFPPAIAVTDGPSPSAPVPAAFPDPAVVTHDSTAILTGYDPTERRVQWIPRRRATRTVPAQQRA
jgi:hypothetical protein